MSNSKTLNRGWLWVRRILSVIAGFAAILVLSIVTDIVLEQTGVFPPPDRGLFDTGLLLIAIAYRSIYSVAGCVIAAKLAPDHPFRHALALGVVGVVISSLGAVAAQALAPVWYSWGLVVLALPLAWLGGKLAERGSGKLAPHEAGSAG